MKRHTIGILLAVAGLLCGLTGCNATQTAHLRAALPVAEAQVQQLQQVANAAQDELAALRDQIAGITDAASKAKAQHVADQAELVAAQAQAKLATAQDAVKRMQDELAAADNADPLAAPRAIADGAVAFVPPPYQQLAQVGLAGLFGLLGAFGLGQQKKRQQADAAIREIHQASGSPPADAQVTSDAAKAAVHRALSAA